MNTNTFSINKFVEHFGVSRALLYKLWKEGKGPDCYYVGKRRFISAEAAQRWIKSLEKQQGGYHA